MSDQLDDIFTPGGVLSRKHPSYCFRSSQLDMANLVEEAFDEGRNAIIEAGTGTGKSFAYLAPSMLRIMNDPKKKVIVATSTITLEKQLYDKDIPFLKDALGFNDEISILFGRSNYACIALFKELEVQNSLLVNDNGSGIGALTDWIHNTKTGERGEIRNYGAARLFPSIASDDKTCRGPRCPYYQECFYFKARRAAMKAKLLVTNHHLFLIDGKHREECAIPFEEDAILPAYDAVVIDEAHHLETEATDVLSASYSREAVERTLDFLLIKDKKLGCSVLDHMARYEKKPGETKEIISKLKTCKNDAAVFDERLEMTFGPFKRDDILFEPEVYNRFRGALLPGEMIAEELADIATRLDIMYKEQIDEDDILHWQNIKKSAGSMNCLADTLRTFIRFSDFQHRIAHAEGKNGRNFELKLSPLEVGPILRKVILDNINSAIFCSATLSLNRSFNYFKEKLGLDGNTLEGVFESPFHYKENLMLLLPRDGVGYRNDQSEEYVKYVASAVKEAILYSGGGALILFTSKRMLEDVHRIVAAELPDFNIMWQGNGDPRSVLLRKFKEDEDSSLFATSSFWEGIDAPGNTLRLVVIVKIPFQVPTTPIYKARCAHLEAEGRFPFVELTVPEAAIKLKQGLGRLIRTEEDKGIVIILDNRIIQKSYGRMLLTSLPECYIPDDTTVGNIGSKIEQFLY